PFYIHSKTYNICYYVYRQQAYDSADLSPALKGACQMIARDIMTRKVATIHPEASAQEAAQLLYQRRISGAPVVDADGKLIGVITEADIISKVNREGLRVADI